MLGVEVLARVESGESDVGLLHDEGPDFAQMSSRLEDEPVCEVDVELIRPYRPPPRPRCHVRLVDLRGYPWSTGSRGCRT